MPPRSLALLPLLAALAACSSGGGGSGGSGGDGADGPFPATYDARVDRMNAHVDAVDARTYTDPSSLPVTGSASYQGGLYIEDVDRDLIGEVDLQVRYSDNSFEGTATNFVDQLDQDYAGTLVLDTPDAIDRDADPTFDYTYRIQLTGELDYPDLGAQTINGNLRGDFYGSEAEYMYADSGSDGLLICDVSDAACSPGIYGQLSARDDD